jgi:hypothetical protein
MKKILTFIGVAALAVQGAFALISVPASFPLEKVNGNSATGKDQLAMLVSRYQNDVVLLANPPSAYSKEVQAVAASPASTEKLKALGTTGGAKLSSDSLASAVSALVRQNPNDAPTIVASAVELLKSVPGGQSVINREKIAKAAIKGLPDDLKNEPKLIAFIIGVAAGGLNDTAVASLVKSLRDFSIDSAPEAEQPTLALSVDQALVDAGVLSPYTASPEFLVMADNFAEGQLGETLFSGDQGTINQGAVLAPGAAGSAGGSGSAGNQINPTPTPQPPPAS